MTKAGGGEIENPYSGILFRFIPVYYGYSLYWDFFKGKGMDPRTQTIKLDDKWAKIAVSFRV